MRGCTGWWLAGPAGPSSARPCVSCCSTGHMRIWSPRTALYVAQVACLPSPRPSITPVPHHRPEPSLPHPPFSLPLLYTLPLPRRAAWRRVWFRLTRPSAAAASSACAMWTGGRTPAAPRAWPPSAQCWRWWISHTCRWGQGGRGRWGGEGGGRGGRGAGEGGGVEWAGLGGGRERCMYAVVEVLADV